MRGRPILVRQASCPHQDRNAVPVSQKRPCFLAAIAWWPHPRSIERLTYGFPPAPISGMMGDAPRPPDQARSRSRHSWCMFSKGSLAFCAQRALAAAGSFGGRCGHLGFLRCSNLYSTTSSAVASSAAGMSMPSALAVLRLTTKLNLVGCTTGRSAGFAPLRIRPV